MLRIPLESTAKYCDGLQRRSFLQLGLAGMGTLGLGAVLRSRAAANEGAAATAGKETSMILIWLDGGPSHMDMYDLKPDAPAEYRGIWRPIPTNVPGMEITELFPLQAKIADLFSIVRSLHHDTGDHFTGGHWMLTGRGGVSGANTPQQYPFFGSYRREGARRTASRACRRMSAVPYAMSIGLRPGYFGGNYLGAEHNPFETDGDPNADNFQVTNISLVTAG